MSAVQPRRAACGLIACLCAAPAAGAQAAAAQVAGGTTVRVGASRAPDTVRVGDPFHVVLRVAAPAGARVDFPSAADSAAPIEVIGGPVKRSAQTSDGTVDVTADYTVAAWTTGAVPIALDSVTVRSGALVRRIAMPSLAVTVRSVLPADSAQRTPKPPRDPLPDLGLWWLRYVALALALLVLVTVLVIWARRALARRRVGVAREDDAFARAVAGFEALDRRGLIALGEGGRHVALAVDLMRDYLVARLPGVATASQTSGELLAAVATHDEVPAALVGPVFTAGDLVKFAAAPVAPADAVAYAADARRVVESTEETLRARAAQAAAEAAARASAEAEERRAYEAERRRAARAAGGGRGREDRAA